MRDRFIASAWKAKRCALVSFLHLLFFLHDFSGISANSEPKKYFADHRTANTIQLFVTTKESFSGLFFFWTCRCKGEFLRDYLINAVTCVFTYYWNRHLVVDKNLLKVTWKQIALTAIFHFGHVFVFCRLESGSQLPKYLCYLLQWKPDKNDGKCFLSHLKLIFLHQDIFIFLLTFWSCRKNCVIRKI